MESRTSETPEASAVPELLSDEEIRSRAAAYAQQVYEQQLEAYRRQREQLSAFLRAQEEYERQRAAYAQACAAWNAQLAGSPAVRVDPDTGEQVFAQENFSADAFPSSVPAACAQPAEGVPAESAFPEENAAAAPGVPAEENPLTAAFAADGEAAQPEAVLADAAPEAAQDFSEDPPPEFYLSEETSSPEASAPPPESSVPAPDARIPAAPPPRRNLNRVPAPAATFSAPPDFPLFGVAVVIVMTALLAVLGYIVFSDDPRFAGPRENFRLLVGWEKENAAPAQDGNAAPASSSPARKEEKPAEKSERDATEVFGTKTVWR